MATPDTTTSSTIGRIEEFDQENESISAYLELFSLYVTMDSIAENKRAPMPLLVLGKSHYSRTNDAQRTDGTTHQAL